LIALEGPHAARVGNSPEIAVYNALAETVVGLLKCMFSSFVGLRSLERPVAKGLVAGYVLASLHRDGYAICYLKTRALHR
jgi:hypothetical protein